MAGVVLSATLLFTACSKSDDSGQKPTEPTEQPVPQPGTDQRPTWTEPDISLYGGDPMTVQITLQDELLPYAGEGDLMCAKLNGEVRAVSDLYESHDQKHFRLSIYGSSNEGDVTLCYYCHQLSRIFTVENWKAFDASTAPTDEGTPYVPPFFVVPTE
jgi:hypothetical protein